MPSGLPPLPPEALPLPVPGNFPDPIPGLIPFNTITMFAGATGAGKTTMAVPWIDAWVNGGRICGYPTSKPTELVWITADRPGAETHEWFARQGLDVSTFKIYSVLDDPQFPMGKLKTVGTVGDAFEYCIDKTSPPPGSLVIFDPLTPLFVMGDTNKARDVALTLIHYTRLCLRKQISLICMGHFGKQKGKQDERYARPQDRIAGSNAFGGFSSTQIYLLDPEPGDPQVWTLGWVPRHNPACQFTFDRNPTTGFFVPVASEYDPDESPETLRKGRRWLLGLLPAPPDVMSFTVVVDLMLSRYGLKRSVAFSHRKKLEDDGLLEIVGRGQVRITTAGLAILTAGESGER